MRIEFADGRVREFEAAHPNDLECVIETPASRRPLPVDLAAELFGAGDVTDVRLGFRASWDPQHRMVMRTEAARSPQQALDEVRAYAEHPSTHEPARDALRDILGR